MIISVTAEDEAMAEPQPKVWNRASVITCVIGSIFSISLSASPQAMAPTSPMASASASTPTFLGLKKYSLTLSV